MKLPPAILDLMWEYDRAALIASEEVPDVVLERVMTRGSWDDMRWLLASEERTRLAAYLERRGSRVLPPRALRFWCLAAGVGEPRATDWVRRARDREASWRG